MTKPGHLDRAAGVMVGLACGDALGAAYEFGGPYPANMPVEMKGGGAFGWEPGEWTDDTAMAVPLLELIETGERPRDLNLRLAVNRWLEWMEDAKDVGNQTSAVLGEADRMSNGDIYEMDGAAMRAAREFQERFPDAAGNGSLMRTAPYGLVGQDLGYVAITAAGQSRLTHPHYDAMTACAIWSAAISHAVGTGELDIRKGLEASAHEILDENSQKLWLSRIEEAEAHPPEYFTKNGWVVQAFQGAWSSIVHSGDRADNDPQHVRRTLEMAVRGGWRHRYSRRHRRRTHRRRLRSQCDSAGVEAPHPRLAGLAVRRTRRTRSQRHACVERVLEELRQRLAVDRLL
jgi:ADP-ribosyl-[dinitrogen reductase] hydrolase